jgi:large conductance mechanosensitive channel
MFNEFKEFAMKGNLVDMAVGFVMGAAFAAVVTAFIQGVFMPLISPVLGGIDLAAWKYEMAPAVLEGGEVVKEAVFVDIGGFVTALISFIIVAFVMFMIIKGMNNAMKEEEAPEEDPGPSQEDLLAEIRDLLAKQS